MIVVAYSNGGFFAGNKAQYAHFQRGAINQAINSMHCIVSAP